MESTYKDSVVSPSYLSLLVPNKKNIRPGHTLLSRKSFKRIKEWGLKKIKRAKQNS